MAAKETSLADLLGVLRSDRVWEYEGGLREPCWNVPKQTLCALEQPLDYPPLRSAVVPGDHVALAVDPNVPQVAEVLASAIEVIRQVEPARIDIVLGDESTDTTLASIRQSTGSSIQVTRHESSHRESLRYLGADQAADPIYLNRLLVDADFVLPIVAGRPLDSACPHDLTGVFPAFADSASRVRYRRQLGSPFRVKPAVDDVAEPAWMLGVQLMVSVMASDRGLVGEIVAGSLQAIGQCLSSIRSRSVPPPLAPLVIASLDGDAQQQSWCNAARAVAAASCYVRPGGTIVLWSEIAVPPAGRLLNLASPDALLEGDALDAADGFPAWDESTTPAQILASIAADHRVLIHCRLDDETIEATGLASIQDIDELSRLSRSFDSCGVLRAAQFAANTLA
jgi:hypothetical protein